LDFGITEVPIGIGTFGSALKFVHEFAEIVAR